jgi:hypothetical protein
MAFKFKTKKRPTAAQAFAGGFAQGVSFNKQHNLVCRIDLENKKILKI